MIFFSVIYMHHIMLLQLTCFCRNRSMKLNLNKTHPQFCLHQKGGDCWSIFCSVFWCWQNKFLISRDRRWRLFLEGFWRWFWKRSRVRLWEHQSGYRTGDAATRNRNIKGKSIWRYPWDLILSNCVRLLCQEKILIGRYQIKINRDTLSKQEKTSLLETKSRLYGLLRFRKVNLFLLKMARFLLIDSNGWTPTASVKWDIKEGLVKSKM